MTIADFIIIYLACGSPFAVQYLSTDSSRLSISLFAGAAARCMLWPMSASLLLYRLASGIKLSPDSLSLRGIENDLDRLRTAIERAKFANQQAAPVFQFRDAFMRYTGLALELNWHVTKPAPAEIFGVAHHPDPAMASACLQRRNRSRLQSHYEQAKADLIALLSQQPAGNEGRDHIMRLTFETAERVGDTAWAIELRSTAGLSGNAQAAHAADEVGELWNTASQSHSIAG